MKNDSKNNYLLPGLIYVLVIVFGFIACVWGIETARAYYHKQTTASMVPALTGTELKLYIPFKVKPDEEEFRLGEVYIDKQGYFRQKKGE